MNSFSIKNHVILEFVGFNVMSELAFDPGQLAPNNVTFSITNISNQPYKVQPHVTLAK